MSNNQRDSHLMPSLPVACGEFLLPRPGVDMTLWPVIACDQFTAQPEYWAKADAMVGDAPSALRLILPEAYLGAGDDIRIAAANAAMRDYIENGVLAPAVSGMVLVERATGGGVRLGLVAVVDLERYDFEPGAKAAIRPTEGTVRERIPPRLRIRQNAALELSHVLLLLDDPQKTVIEPLYQAKSALKMLYDTDLMLSGGHIRGWAVPEGEWTDRVFTALTALRDALPDDAPLLAVGDGNHSLATARSHWLAVRQGLTDAARANHPARFAMVEIENLHSDALAFAPIHRFVFGCSVCQILEMLPSAAPCQERPDAVLADKEREIPIRFERPLHPLPVGTVQALLDRQPGISLDYIHGEDAVHELACNGHGTGILLPAMDKSLLFPAIAQGGVLPRKTFSMGEAHEKRYYMEARCIR